jgi:hypothetical protein
MMIWIGKTTECVPFRVKFVVKPGTGILMTTPKKMNRVSEEKQLNDLFVLLEYSETFEDFIKGMPEESRLRIFTEIKRYYGD